MPRRILIAALSPIVALLLAAGPALGRVEAAAQPSPIASPTAGAVPDTPVGRRLAWVLATLENGAAALTEAEVSARFAPAFFAVLPPAQAVAGTRQAAAAIGPASFHAIGPASFQGFVRPPTDLQAVGLVTGRSGDRFVVIVAVEAAAPHLIRTLTLQPAPPSLTVADPGDERIGGLVDIGGRRLYLDCTGPEPAAGGPTVVLEAGHGNDSTIWLSVQGAVGPDTRVCSYDRANAPGGAIDPAPTPRTAEEVVADLHALL